MLVNYFKLKNISRRGKAIALSVVGGVFILLVLFSLWNRYFADTLIRYAPSDSILYIHFSRPKINDSAKIDQVLSKLFQDLKLPDYQSLDINREVAIISQLKDNQNKYAVIIKTDRPSRVKKILMEAKLKYKKLSYDTFLLADESLINGYQKPKNNYLKSDIRKRFYPLSSVNIYISSQFFTSNIGDTNLDLIYSLLKNENNDLIISFKAQGDKLKMHYGGLSSVARSPDKFKSQDLKPDILVDVVFASSDFYTLLNNWKNNLKAVSPEDYQLFSISRLNVYLNTYLNSENRLIFLSASKNNNDSGWVFSDYDFYLSLDNIYTGKVEEILKSIMAYKYPIIKSVYLSDGTRVAELLPDAEQFYFLEKNGIKYLYSPDDKFKLMYKTEGNIISISNSESLINQDWPELGFNYLKFKSGLLSDSGLARYLKYFESLEISSDGLILK